MANLRNLYNPEAEAQQDYAPLPSGEYLAQITDSDMKPTKKGDGQYLELEYTVIDGEHKGRKTWVRLNLENPNNKAVEIANRQFAAIREATGVANPETSEQLHFKPHVIRVEFIPAGTTKGNYTTDKDSNEVRGWRAADGAAVAAPQQQAPARQAASAAPWKKAS